MSFEGAPQHLPYDFVCLNADVGSLPNLGHEQRGRTVLVMDTGAVYIYGGSGTTWYLLPTPATPVIGAGTALIGHVVVDAPVATATVFTPDTDFGTVTKKSVKASAGNLYYISCFNKNAALRYLQLHNKASAPAGADVPIESWPIPAGSANAPGFFGIGSAELGMAGRRCSTGVAWAISTTQATFTDSATAGEHGVDLGYL